MSMAIGAVGHCVLAFLVGHGLLHVQRGEDAVVKKIAEGLARHFFHHHGQHSIAGVAVIPPGAGRKFCGLLFFQQLQHAGVFNLGNFFRRRAGRGLRHQVFVVEQA